MRRIEINGKVYYTIIGLIFFVLCMSYANSSSYDDLGYTRTNQPYNLSLGCSYNNTYCANTFVCNVSIISPNGIVLNNQQMGSALFPQYNYTLLGSQIAVNGLYYGRQVCCGATAGCSNDYSFQFHVNPQGKEYGSSDGTIYLALLLLLSGIFFCLLWFSIKIPMDNVRGEDGIIAAINWKKYFKIFLFMMAYVCLIGLTYLSWNISYGILQFDEMANIFQMMFRMLMILILPLFILITIIGFIMWVSDKKLQEKIQRGISVYD